MSDLPPAPAKGKIWSVGTLTYTSTGIIVLFCWLLWGDFAWSMRERSTIPMAQWFLKEIGTSGLVFGLLMSSFPALVGLFFTPIISVRSDRHRGKWGRRIPYLLITTPIAAFGMLGIAFTPTLAPMLHGIIPDEHMAKLVCFGVFWAAFEFAALSGLAILNALINDVVPEELLGRFYGLFRVVSLVGGMIFNFRIMGLVPHHFTLIMATIAVFYAVAFTWVCLKVKEGNYPPPPPIPENAPGLVEKMAGSVGSYFKESFTHPYYLWVFVMMMAATLCFVPINTFDIPYAKSLNIDMDWYGKSKTLTYGISLILAYPLGWLCDRFHPLRITLASLVAYGIVSGLGVAFGTTQWGFLGAFVLHGVISGAFFTASASIMQRLFPRDKFAQFFSAAGIILSLATIPLAPSVGAAIDWAHGDYRYTFAAGFALAIISLVAGWQVYTRWLKLGGAKHYVAP